MVHRAILLVSLFFSTPFLGAFDDSHRYMHFGSSRTFQDSSTSPITISTGAYTVHSRYSFHSEPWESYRPDKEEESLKEITWSVMNWPAKQLRRYCSWFNIYDNGYQACLNEFPGIYEFYNFKFKNTAFFGMAARGISPEAVLRTIFYGKSISTNWNFGVDGYESTNRNIRVITSGGGLFSSLKILVVRRCSENVFASSPTPEQEAFCRELHKPFEENARQKENEAERLKHKKIDAQLSFVEFLKRYIKNHFSYLY